MKSTRKTNRWKMDYSTQNTNYLIWFLSSCTFCSCICRAVCWDRKNVISEIWSAPDSLSWCNCSLNFSILLLSASEFNFSSSAAISSCSKRNSSCSTVGEKKISLGTTNQQRLFAKTSKCIPALRIIHIASDLVLGNSTFSIYYNPSYLPFFFPYFHHFL